MAEGRPRIPFVRLAAEVVAIFLGVTLGFMAEDYREYLNDRDREEEALAQILQDLELDSADVFPMLGQTQWMAQASRWLTNQATRRDSPDSVEFVVDSINQTPMFTYEASASAYMGLKSTGRIDLIRDATLKRRIVRYFEDRQPAIAAVNGQWYGASRRWWDRMAGYVIVAETPPSQPYADIRVPDPSQVLDDRALMYLTLEMGGWSTDFNGYVTELLEMNRELAAAVRAYLAEM